MSTTETRVVMTRNDAAREVYRRQIMAQVRNTLPGATPIRWRFQPRTVDTLLVTAARR